MGVFTREDQETLNYDEDAFFYFAGTILLLICVPWTMHLAYRIVVPALPGEQQLALVLPGPPKRGVRGAAAKGRKDQLRERVCATEAMEEKRRQQEATRFSLSHRFRRAIRLQLFAVFVCWLCFSWVLFRLQSARDLRSFDPHEILGIAKGADEPEIKRAYRRMSLISHPDKNPDDPTAAATFQKVTKAYQALTNEQARKNYEKYGNPDGPTGMKLSVALHPAMMEKNNQLFTLCGFFFVLFVVVPSCALTYYFRTKDYASNGILIETLRVLDVCIDRATRANDGLALLAASLEARRLATRSDRADLAGVLSAVAERQRSQRKGGHLELGSLVQIHSLKGATELNGRQGPIKSFVKETGRYEVILNKNEASKAIKPENLKLVAPSLMQCPFADAPIQRGYFLIMAHLHRLHSEMNPQAKWELDEILRFSLRLCRAMVGMASTGPGDRSRFFECAKGFVEFQRCLVQAVDIGASPLLQLPHIKEETLKDNPDLAAMSLRDAAKAPDDFFGKLKKNNGLSLSSQQELDLRQVFRHLPLVELEAEVYVEDEDVIAENDVATLKVTLRRTQLEKGEAAGPVHAPFFPLPKYETWWLMVYDDHARRLIVSDLVSDQGHEVETQTLFQVSRHGDFQWTVHAFCDSYAGLDISLPVRFRSLRQKEANRKIFIHPDDMHIRSLFEEIMMGLQPPESDDDSDSDAEPQKPAAVVKASPEVDSDDDDEEPAAVEQAVPKEKPVEEAAPEEKPKAQDNGKPLVETTNNDDSSDDENYGPEGHIYAVVAPHGAFVTADPEVEDESARVGWYPVGRLVRGLQEVEVDGGGRKMLLLAGAGPDRPPTFICASRKKPQEATIAKYLGALRDQPLKHVVSTVTPVSMVGQWIKHNPVEKIDKHDVFQVQQIENDCVRLKVLAMVQDKVGTERYAELATGAAEMEDKRDDLASKTRGVWVTDNGSKWRVTPDLVVQGIPEEGKKIRDKLEILDARESSTGVGQVRLGPFALDHSRSEGCCCWVQADNPSRQMIWRPDRWLESRMQFMW